MQTTKLNLMKNFHANEVELLKETIGQLEDHIESLQGNVSELTQNAILATQDCQIQMKANKELKALSKKQKENSTANQRKLMQQIERERRLTDAAHNKAVEHEKCETEMHKK